MALRLSESSAGASWFVHAPDASSSENKPEWARSITKNVSAWSTRILAHRTAKYSLRVAIQTKTDTRGQRALSKWNASIASSAISIAHTIASHQGTRGQRMVHSAFGCRPSSRAFDSMRWSLLEKACAFSKARVVPNIHARRATTTTPRRNSSQRSAHQAIMRTRSSQKSARA
jgi:hypothetical protein